MGSSFNQTECNVHPWIIEPFIGKYLYVRLNGVYLRRHNAINHMISTSSIKTSFASDCQTSARIILTNGEGLSVTACPVSENAADSNYVDIYSSGWEDSFEQKNVVPSREISIEYLYPDRETYIVTWFEMVPRMSLGLVGECHEMRRNRFSKDSRFNNYLIFLTFSSKLHEHLSGDGRMCQH